MRNVKSVGGEKTGFTCGRRTILGRTEVAVLWEDDETFWYSEAELDSILV
jgi:hypothetical protein